MCERPPELDGCPFWRYTQTTHPLGHDGRPHPLSHTHVSTHTHTHIYILLDVVVVRVRPTHTFKRTYLHIRCQCPSIPHRRRLNCVCPLKERPKMKVLSLVRRQPSNVRPLASLKICSWHEHMWRNFVADFCSLTGQGDCVHCNKTALFFPYYGGNLISYDNRRLEETDVLHIKHRMGQEDKVVL